MGPIRVAQLTPNVITPHRFRTKREFWAYCGLTRSSADWVRQDSRWVNEAAALLTMWKSEEVYDRTRA